MILRVLEGSALASHSCIEEEAVVAARATRMTAASATELRTG